MAASSKDGPLQPSGETYECQGLYVADASTFPTSLGVNPMITVRGGRVVRGDRVVRGGRVVRGVRVVDTHTLFEHSLTVNVICRMYPFFVSSYAPFSIHLTHTLSIHLTYTLSIRLQVAAMAHFVSRNVLRQHFPVLFEKVKNIELCNGGVGKGCKANKNNSNDW